jgi:hypothetical protein
MTWTQAIPTHVADSDFQADHAVMAVTVDRVSGRTAFVRHAKSPRSLDNCMLLRGRKRGETGGRFLRAGHGVFFATARGFQQVTLASTQTSVLI